MEKRWVRIRVIMKITVFFSWKMTKFFENLLNQNKIIMSLTFRHTFDFYEILMSPRVSYSGWRLLLIVGGRFSKLNILMKLNFFMIRVKLLSRQFQNDKVLNLGYRWHVKRYIFRMSVHTVLSRSIQVVDVAKRLKDSVWIWF